MDYKRIKGTQDIYDEEIAYWRYFEEKTRKVLLTYGYKEIRTPIMEPTELFSRGVGEGTDIVQKEMYTFEDKGGRSITLRPEGTAAVVRAYVENSMVNLGTPLKLFYMGPMFRYEKPQAGRLRQFHQLGAELFGSDHPLADAEVISLMYHILTELKLKNIIVRINSIGCSECRAKYKQALKEYFAERLSTLCDDCKKRYETNPMRLLDCKIDTEAAAGAPSILDYICDDCKDHFEKVKEYLEINEVKFVVDPRIVRGLDYYNRTAFEMEDEVNKVILGGGGRYDGLIQEVGGDNIPGVGFAFGIERVLTAIRDEKIDVKPEEKIDVYIIYSGEEAEKYGVKLAWELRSKNINTFINISKRNFGGQFKHANRLKAKFCVIIGEDEVKNNIFNLKNMETGEQTSIEKDWFVNILLEKLGR